MARDGPELCATAFFRSQFLIGLAAHLDDVGDSRQGLDVINDGWRRIQTGNRRKGRLHARMAAKTFERAEQRSFFAADVRARARVRVNFATEITAQNV